MITRETLRSCYLAVLGRLPLLIAGSLLRAVITDLHMPNQDGFAFVTALRRTLPDIPVVVSSGRLDGDAKERFQALGVTSFLGKPFTEGRLVEVLRGLFPAA